MNGKICVCIVHALGVEFRCNTLVGYICQLLFSEYNFCFGSNLFQQ